MHGIFFNFSVVCTVAVCPSTIVTEVQLVVPPRARAARARIVNQSISISRETQRKDFGTLLASPPSSLTMNKEDVITISELCAEIGFISPF